MANGTWIGISSIARKIKNIYIGVGGVARKVKKAYIGVGGVAKLFFSAERNSISYYSSSLTTNGNIHENGYGFKSTSNNNHAFFASGSTLSAFNPSLVKSSLSYGSYANIGTMGHTSSYNIAAGGTTSSDAGINAIYAYNSSLTANTTATLARTMKRLFSGTLNDYVFWFGGFSGSLSHVSYVYAMSNDLVMNTCTSLSYARSTDTASASIGNHLLIVGGFQTTSQVSDNSKKYIKVVEVYNSDLTKGTSYSLSTGYSYGHCGKSNSTYALFAGGTYRSSDTFSKNIISVNADLTINTAAASLTTGVVELAGVSSEDIAIFAGGRTSTGNTSQIKTVQYYNKDLTKTLASDMGTKRYCHAGESIGDYVLFAGGYDGTTYDYKEDGEWYEGYNLCNTIDVYQF